MLRREGSKLGVVGGALLMVGLACNLASPGGLPTVTPDPPTPTVGAATATPGLPPAGSCGEGETTEMVWPTLDSVEPAPPVAGQEIKVVGSGGFEQCGEAFNESARDFQLYWDGEPIATLGCYVNHCEVTFAVPEDANGTHELSVEGGSTLEIDVAVSQ